MSTTIVTEKQAPIAYQPPPEGTIWHGDGREQALQQYLSSRRAEIGGNPQAVLDAIDDFGRSTKYLMNVGDAKGAIVEDVIRAARPKTILELGTYCGYSTIAFARHLSERLFSGANAVLPEEWASLSGESAERVGYVCLEKDPAYAAVAKAGVELAGLGDIVKIIIGSSSVSLRNMRQTLGLPQDWTFDMVFIDHWKTLYTLDIKILEEEGLIGPGTTIVADNVIKPGNPEYLAYVRASREEREGMSLSEVDGVSAKGNPRFAYESKTMESYEPYTAMRDGVEVSKVVSVK